MTIKLHDFPLPLEAEETELAGRVEKALGLRAGTSGKFQICRKSLDARRKDRLHFVYTLVVEVPAGWKPPRKPAAGVRIEILPEESFKAERVPAAQAFHGQRASARETRRPLVVGSGPAGLFAALVLARQGFRPLLAERGRPVEERTRDVERFLKDGTLDPESNIQFGEGGAGTFSDGKLATNIRDPRCGRVLEELVAAGAPAEILYLAKPHIGTDLLRRVVTNLRGEILAKGGEFRFGTRFSDFSVEAGAVRSVSLTPSGAGGGAVRLPSLSPGPADSGSEAEKIEVSGLILAPGNSGREVFELLLARGVVLEAKPFSVGLRIEHPQELIDRAQYGRYAGHPRLGAADYKLVHHCGNGRSVYTFCMCPGGYVVPGASELGGLATNGMSEHARDGGNANSALLVGIDLADFGGTGPLAGVAFQRYWERTAFAAGGGGYKAPVQRLEDFLLGRPSEKPGSVHPTYRPGVVFGDVAACLPAFAATALREALPVLGRKLKGFDFPDAVLTAVETRSSSPVRIPRGETGEASIGRFFPAGEGAGYAGGIMSAAVDGIRAAEAFLAHYG